MKKGTNPYKTISREVIHSRNHMNFVKTKVLINGKEKDYSYADISDGIGIVAVNDKGEVALVGQWRYAIETYEWEIPAGMREDGEDPLDTAKRELREEAGCTAKSWKKLGSFFMESNATNKVAHAFLATDLEMCDTDFDDDENIEIEWIPLEEAVEKVLNGEIKNGLSSLGLLTARAQPELQRKLQL